MITTNKGGIAERTYRHIAAVDYLGAHGVAAHPADRIVVTHPGHIEITYDTFVGEHAAEFGASGGHIYIIHRSSAALRRTVHHVCAAVDHLGCMSAFRKGNACAVEQPLLAYTHIHHYTVHKSITQRLTAPATGSRGQGR